MSGHIGVVVGGIKDVVEGYVGVMYFELGSLVEEFERLGFELGQSAAVAAQ